MQRALNRVMYSVCTVMELDIGDGMVHLLPQGGAHAIHDGGNKERENGDDIGIYKVILLVNRTSPRQDTYTHAHKMIDWVSK